MADEADDAKAQEEFSMKMAIRNLAANQTKLQPCGECYACEAELDDGVDEQGEPVHRRLFCDLACSKDYERMKRRM